jgi:acyl-CoA reductase-like NAD-dependent aldehyde dehydrogenase
MSAKWNFDLFIDGKWEKGESGQAHRGDRPATEEVIGIVPEASPSGGRSRQPVARSTTVRGRG